MGWRRSFLQSDIVLLQGTPNTITSSVDGVVSLGHQAHELLFPDGSIGFILNRGSLNGSGNGVTLLTSADGGATWTQQLTLPNSDDPASTSDVKLVDAGGGVYTLWIVYASNLNPRTVQLSLLRRSALGVWSNITPGGAGFETAYSEAGIDASAPTICLTGSGASTVAWIAFPTTAQSGNLHDIRLVRRMGAGVYPDTTKHFGAQTSLPIVGTGRAAKLLNVATGVAVHYTVPNAANDSDDQVYEVNATGDVTSWTGGIIRQDTSGDRNPDGSHHSLAFDGTIWHEAFIQNHQLCYQQLRPGGIGWGAYVNGVWTDDGFVGLTPPIQAAYCQASILASGTIVLLCNDDTAFGRGFQSFDGGITWFHTHTLRHPGIGTSGILDMSNPRVRLYSNGAPSIEALFKAAVIQYSRDSGDAYGLLGNFV